jgi:hypothetical protein
MSKETHHTTPDSDSEPMRATRRTALRGAGFAGLLSVGVGSATASQRSPEVNIHQTENETDDPVPVM